ncbi:PEP-CTERM sorting domain-containing protein [Alishewanella jeotgali]|uniref:PEP-CTERM protein-sorting domain-containing protein n=1 Tax=Alishewanella jeotgali KCTC 22429 TaxID=1129374 RepID=H3ZB18_9ALTE|nr:PEP-CTERM sorting domain-containing protein [Alishewanella jeotgali]EHR42132.1 hypothetical protein AJE_02616 [Alishewanella jeotgali KCTC 22429]
MFKKIFAGTALLLACCMAHASLIEYNGYSRDSSSNIVIGGGLEWLMWDVTKGMSINAALIHYASNGWELASNDQMTALFNAFEFGRSDWYSVEDVTLFSYVPWTPSETSRHSLFIQMFGMTFTTTCSSSIQVGCYISSDPYIRSSAIYGSDTDSNGLFKLASVNDDALRRYWGWSGNFELEQYHHEALLYNDYVTLSSTVAGHGIALVRQINSSPTTPLPVSVPTSLSLITLGLIGLAYRRRITRTYNA